jgi:hypothetical protein
MVCVDVHFIHLDHRLHVRIGQADQVRIVAVVVDRAVQLGGDVLDQAAAEEHVNHLNAPADADHGPVVLDRPVEQVIFHLIACGRDLERSGVGLSVTFRGDIAAAAQDPPSRQRGEYCSQAGQVIRDQDRP